MNKNVSNNIEKYLDLNNNKENIIKNNYNFIQNNEEDSKLSLIKLNNENNKLETTNLLELPNKFLNNFNKLTNDQKFISFFLLIFCWYFINKINFNSKNFISLCLSIVLIYIFLQTKYKRNFIKRTKIEKTMNDLNLFKYKYLNLDINISNCFYNLSFLKKMNYTSFNNSINFMNEFMKIVFQLSNKNFPKNSNVLNTSENEAQIIENAIIFRKKSLNELLSTVCSTPQLIGRKKNIYFLLPLEKKITHYTKLLDFYSNRKLLEIINKNNKQFNNIANINYNSNFIYINQPEPNPLEQKNYNPSYNLY